MSCIPQPEWDFHGASAPENNPEDSKLTQILEGDLSVKNPHEENSDVENLEKERLRCRETSGGLRGPQILRWGLQNGRHVGGRLENPPENFRR